MAFQRNIKKIYIYKHLKVLNFDKEFENCRRIENWFHFTESCVFVVVVAEILKPFTMIIYLQFVKIISNLVSCTKKIYRCF